jgi:hypothetical protein
MVAERTCRGIGNKGEHCRALALRDSDFCVFHDPEHAEAVAEGRRMGGLRRRREGTLAAAYDLDGLATLQEIRRLLEIATLDTLNLENSVARNRVLIAATVASASSECRAVACISLVDSSTQPELGRVVVSSDDFQLVVQLFMNQARSSSDR